GRQHVLAEQLLGVALGGGDLRQFLLDEVVEARLGGFQLAQRHIVLVVEVAKAVAGSRPSGVFGKRSLDVVFAELLDQRDDLAGQLPVGDRKRRLGADDERGGGVGG